MSSDSSGTERFAAAVAPSIMTGTHPPKGPATAVFLHRMMQVAPFDPPRQGGMVVGIRTTNGISLTVARESPAAPGTFRVTSRVTNSPPSVDISHLYGPAPS